MRVLDKLLEFFNNRPHECEACKDVLPSHRARFHAGVGSVIMLAPLDAEGNVRTDTIETNFGAF